ncbi:MAG TPA: cation diffusion facilitator family transporter [Methanothrix sp.]|uniref:cation diffusion facilitator family transporter n=1 Tax=Methanothrix sp. TaxID=90426 RepID=UPI002BF4AAE7|nr:cation diffusion facilitator family transporter [Methanothrix sp.]MDI9416360.1 cation diffusion facilitator family transporter [Euryarchaeota archaeon]HON34721.1 cation diffusion facilitator family transporter [Methanothrix sp.]HRU75654.1 cation diffusion facilitator family transporter [Methanothrix sp.]
MKSSDAKARSASDSRSNSPSNSIPTLSPSSNPPSVLRVAFYSLLFNLSLVVAKLILSSLSGSLALRADAVHSTVDVLASLALILGVKISERKSESFPLGLYKVENLASIVISFLLFLTAYEIIIEAVRGDAVLISYQGWVLYAVAAIIPLPYLFGSFQIKVGERTGSPSLIADGVQHKADVLTSSLVFLALIAQSVSFPLDRIAAVIIALVIVKEGWKILVSGMRVLLDASVDAATLEEIRTQIMEAPEVVSISELVARNSGRYLFVQASLTLRVADLRRAHQVSERIESRIKREIPQVDRVQIHYEPIVESRRRYAAPLADMRGTLSKHFGESPYFALVEIDFEEMRLLRQEIVANPHKDLIKGKGLKVAQFLLGFKPDVVFSSERLEGKGPGYAFAEAGVETLQTDAGTLEELMAGLLQAEGSTNL